MKRVEALEILKKYWEKPVFCTKIGMCSPQVENVTLEEAMAAMDTSQKFTTEFFEFVYIYPSDYVTDYDDINKALNLFNLGSGRAALNVEKWT